MADEIDFNTVEDKDDEVGMSPEDFKGSGFLKNPDVGNEITFVVQKVVENKMITGKRTDGQQFSIGLKKKDGSVKRYDIHTDQGVYTISNWEIYFKLLGNKGLLMAWAKAHGNNFAGAKITVKKLLDGGHASTKIKDLAKIINMTEEKATEYQNDIKKAIKEQRLYDVRVE